MIIARGFLKAVKLKYKGEEIKIFGKKELKVFFYDYDFFGFKSYYDYYRVLCEFKKKGLEKIFILPPSFSSAFFPFLAGIKERTGYDTDQRGLLLTKKIDSKYLKKEHLLKSYLRLINFENDYERFYPDLKLFDKPEKNTCVIAPFASYGSAKEWVFYKELADFLLKKGFRVYVVGKKKRDNFPEGVLNLSGETDLNGLLKIISKAEYIFSNDSGVAHVASAMNKKVFVFFGSTSPLWTKPLGKNVYVFYKKNFCSPCFKRECAYKTYECMRKIKPEEVITLFEILR